MTPLIDVVFQLLIFFICASTGHLKELLLATDLRPGDVTSSTEVEHEKPLGDVWIRLRRSNDATIALLEDREFDKLSDLEETLKSLAAVAPEIPVNLDIADDVALGDVIQIYDTCRAARFRSVNFATNSKRLQNAEK